MTGARNLLWLCGLWVVFALPVIAQDDAASAPDPDVAAAGSGQEHALAWFVGNWRVEYYDQNIGSISGTASVRLVNGKALATIHFRPNDSRERTQLYGTNIRQDEDKLIMDLVGEVPSTATLVHGAASVAEVEDAHEIALPTRTGGTIEVTLDKQVAILQVQPEPATPVRAPLRLELDLFDEETRDTELRGFWIATHLEPHGFKGQRTGKVEPGKTDMRGFEKWTRLNAEITDIEPIDIQHFGRYLVSSQTFIEGDVVADIWLRLKGRNLPAPDDDLVVHFDDESITYARMARRGETGDLELAVKLRRNLIPGRKGFTLNEIPAEWEFVWPGLEVSEVRFVRQPNLDTFDPAQELYLGELTFVELVFNLPPYFASRTGSLRRSRKNNSGEISVTTLDSEMIFTRDDKNPRVFRSNGYVLPPNTAAAEAVAEEGARSANVFTPIPPGARQVEVAEGDMLVSMLTDDKGMDREPTVGAAAIAALPDDVWARAKSRAKTCYLTRNNPLKDKSARGYVISHLVITDVRGRTVPTGFTRSRIIISQTDHAALLLARDELVDHLDRVVNRPKPPDLFEQEPDDEKRKVLFAAREKERRAYARQVVQTARGGVDEPLFVFTVTLPGGSRMTLGEAFAASVERDYFQGDAEAYSAWAVKAIMEAEDTLFGHAAQTLIHVKAIDDADVEGLLNTVGISMGAIVPGIRPKLVMPTSDGSGRIVPDREGLAAVDRLSGLYETVTAQQSYAQLSRDFAMLAFTAASMGVGGVASGFAKGLSYGARAMRVAGFYNHAMRAARAARVLASGASVLQEAGTGMDLVMAAVDVGEYSEAELKVLNAKGQIEIAGVEALRDAEAERTAAAWSAGLAIGGEAAGRLLGPAVARVLRNQSEIEAAIEAGGKYGWDSLSAAERQLLKEARQVAAAKAVGGRKLSDLDEWILLDGPPASTYDSVAGGADDLVRAGDDLTAAADDLTPTRPRPTPAGGDGGPATTHPPETTPDIPRSDPPPRTTAPDPPPRTAAPDPPPRTAAPDRPPRTAASDPPSSSYRRARVDEGMSRDEILVRKSQAERRVAESARTNQPMPAAERRAVERQIAAGRYQEALDSAAESARRSGIDNRRIARAVESDEPLTSLRREAAEARGRRVVPADEANDLRTAADRVASGNGSADDFARLQRLREEAAQNGRSLGDELSRRGRLDEAGSFEPVGDRSLGRRVDEKLTEFQASRTDVVRPTEPEVAAPTHVADPGPVVRPPADPPVMGHVEIDELVAPVPDRGSTFAGSREAFDANNLELDRIRNHSLDDLASAKDTIEKVLRGELTVPDAELIDLYNRTAGTLALEDLERQVLLARRAGVSEDEIAESLLSAIDRNKRVTQRNVNLTTIDLEQKILRQEGYYIVEADRDLIAMFKRDGFVPGSIADPTSNLKGVQTRLATGEATFDDYLYLRGLEDNFKQTNLTLDEGLSRTGTMVGDGSEFQVLATADDVDELADFLRRDPADLPGFDAERLATHRPSLSTIEEFERLNPNLRGKPLDDYLAEIEEGIGTQHRPPYEPPVDRSAAVAYSQNESRLRDIERAAKQHLDEAYRRAGEISGGRPPQPGEVAGIQRQIALAQAQDSLAAQVRRARDAGVLEEEISEILYVPNDLDPIASRLQASRNLDRKSLQAQGYTIMDDASARHFGDVRARVLNGDGTLADYAYLSNIRDQYARHGKDYTQYLGSRGAYDSQAGFMPLADDRIARRLDDFLDNPPRAIQEDFTGTLHHPRPTGDGFDPNGETLNQPRPVDDGFRVTDTGRISPDDEGFRLTETERYSPYDTQVRPRPPEPVPVPDSAFAPLPTGPSPDLPPPLPRIGLPEPPPLPDMPRVTAAPDLPPPGFAIPDGPSLAPKMVESPQFRAARPGGVHPPRGFSQDQFDRFVVALRADPTAAEAQVIVMYGSRTHFTAGYGAGPTSDLDMMFFYGDSATNRDIARQLAVNDAMKATSADVGFKVEAEFPTAATFDEAVKNEFGMFRAGMGLDEQRRVYEAARRRGLTRPEIRDTLRETDLVIGISRESVIAIRPIGNWTDRIIQLRALGYENIIVLK